MDLAMWLRATMDVIESDARSHLALHPGEPDWPALALADVAAKRQILDLHQRVDARPGWEGYGQPEEPACYGCNANFGEEYAVPDANDCPVVRLLALAYADQPGYNEAWRP